MGDALYIVIPVYNEEETIESVVSQWYSIVEQVGASSRLLVIDDGSKDGTAGLLNELGKSKPQLLIISKSNSGHGGTVLYGYQYALLQGADYIFQTDSDGQTDPDEFWSFWNLRECHDMVIGKRVDRQDGLSRVIVTKVLKYVIRIRFGINATDANTPFRLMSKRTLSQCIDLIPDGYNLSNVVLTVIYYKMGLQVKYLPITFGPRQGGVNSLNLKNILVIGKHALQDFKELNECINEISMQVDWHNR